MMEAYFDESGTHAAFRRASAKDTKCAIHKQIEFTTPECVNGE